MNKRAQWETLLVSRKSPEIGTGDGTQMGLKAPTIQLIDGSEGCDNEYKAMRRLAFALQEPSFLGL